MSADRFRSLQRRIDLGIVLQVSRKNRVNEGMVTEQKTVVKITAGRTNEPVTAQITALKPIQKLEWRIVNAEGETEVQQVQQPAEEGLSCEFQAQFAAKAWAVESPVLYALECKVLYADGTEEAIADRFGFRYFETDEKNIYLNGYPFYMRAYIRGCAAHEHQNNCNLEEYDFYKKNILMAKEYGFNTIRFHSVIPPEACFRAADELGILIHIEMRRDRQDYDNLKEMLYGKNDFVSDEELLEIVQTLYNHPSFMVYCVGNEIREPGKKPRIRAIRDFIKQHDPTRLFIDTCAHGEYDRDYVDFDVQHMGYYFPYGRNADMFENMDNLLCFGAVRDVEMVAENGGNKIRRGIQFDRPLIAHEVCHYTSWRDFYALKRKFEQYNRPAPWWVDEEIKMIEAKGYQENFAETLQITKDFQFRCWKTALEGIRASKVLSGFHMLQFADTDKYENSNGVVDCFDDPHGISAEEFRKFNADTVLLARPEGRIFRGGELVKIPVLLSQYRINPPLTGTFRYELKCVSAPEPFVVSEGSMDRMDTGLGGLNKLCGLELQMPKLSKPEKMILTCSLDFDGADKCENSWELWVFPEEKEPVLAAENKMQEDYLSRTCRFKEQANLVITDQLNDELFDLLEQGKDVMLLYRTDWTRHLLHKGMDAPKYSFRHTWERFKGVIWDRGTINGGKDAADLLNKYGFVTDGQINYQYYPLIDDCDKINLDDFPADVENLISGIDKSSRDRFDVKKFKLPELMYDRTMRHFSYAFAVKVGKGRLLVTGMNFTGAAAQNPAVLAMLKTLVSYCGSDDFRPEGSITVEELKEYLGKVAKEGPQKERMMTQYWQLDAEPVESMEYWTESERYLREDMK